MNRSVWVGVLGVLLAVGVLFLAPVAQAAKCGSAGADGEPLAGSLLLKTEESTTSLDFGASSDVEDLILFFDVSGCTVSSDEGIVVKPHVSKIEDAFGEPEIDALGTKLVVEIPVDGDKVDPGKHSAAITVGGPAINTNVLKAPVQRKAEPLVPTLIALLCAVIGVGVGIFVTQAKADKPVKFKFIGIATAVVLGFIAAGAVWKTGYVDAELWKIELKTVLALIIGALPAAFGAAVGSLKTVVKPQD